MVVRGRRSSELAALHDAKRTLNNRGGGGGGRSSVSSISDVSSIAGSVASKVKLRNYYYIQGGSKRIVIGCVNLPPQPGCGITEPVGQAFLTILVNLDPRI